MNTGRPQKAFSHIYVEQKVRAHPQTARILESFREAEVIAIEHYKDVFNRSRQSFCAQKQEPALILAKKEGRLVYEGAPVCQNFGHTYFYYTSCMMNCLFDCEYCYLQGMYPSGNIVVFVNLEDIFAEVEKLLGQHPVYLCVSYDTDLLALEGIAGFVKRWYDFAAVHADLTIEIRTKSGAFDKLASLAPLPNVIFAWTLSPEPVIKAWEHKTAPLQTRIRQAKNAADLGFQVRLCFDPLIYIPDFYRIYGAFIDQVFKEPISVMDVSAGVFRVSGDYLKRMRRQRPGCSLLQFPFESENGVCSYGAEISKAMTDYVTQCLTKYVDKEKVFVWSEKNE